MCVDIGTKKRERTAQCTRARTQMKIYTKTGDNGTTSLYNMKRKYKTSKYFLALGDVDELIANIGMAREQLAVNSNSVNNSNLCLELDGLLNEIQSRLMDVASHVATPATSSTMKQLDRTRFSADHITALEEWIDALDRHLPPLRNFIVPSGGMVSAWLHICRTVCRRAERSVVPLVIQDAGDDTGNYDGSNTNEKGANRTISSSSSSPSSSSPSSPSGDAEIVVLHYLNRLSDFLFVAARYAAMRSNREEKTYCKAREGALDRPDNEDSREAGTVSFCLSKIAQLKKDDDGACKSLESQHRRQTLRATLIVCMIAVLVMGQFQGVQSIM